MNQPDKPQERPRHWMLFDGDCGMCRRCAHWVIRNDSKGKFIGAPFQNTPSPPMTLELKKACAFAVHVVKSDGEILRGGVAAMFLIREIVPRPWGFIPRLLGQAPWIVPIEIGYQIIARNRLFFARFILPDEPKAPLEPTIHE